MLKNFEQLEFLSKDISANDMTVDLDMVEMRGPNWGHYRSCEEPEDLQVRWIKHYNSEHKILLVGEGDFSFSTALAVAFDSAANITATSLDSIEFLSKNYSRALLNIDKQSLGAVVMHNVDATNMANISPFKFMLFDRLVYNFPLAGFFNDEKREDQICRHQKLVQLFLENAKKMILIDGEIHITHKSNDGFYKDWDLEFIASGVGLQLIEEVPFDFRDYPGYRTKYGFGGDKNFNSNPSKTYKFGHKNLYQNPRYRFYEMMPSHWGKRLNKILSPSKTPSSEIKNRFEVLGKSSTSYVDTMIPSQSLRQDYFPKGSRITIPILENDHHFSNGEVKFSKFFDNRMFFKTSNPLKTQNHEAIFDLVYSHSFATPKKSKSKVSSAPEIQIPKSKIYFLSNKQYREYLKRLLMQAAKSLSQLCDSESDEENEMASSSVN